ncbi:hypothetical protein [Kribbella sp. VKM Ac-2568]|uniref:hypothetical protein n=1 Tax=Kribbella sp. VKM Ac-2568 TaxID=2512219 RepID=UPI0010467A9B|nr:hypothetical protein [Kribbella sp. VKM Ac-2568]TCM48739.1 hypothetical protein EV648_1033 [Kribbella sp. VKM Ac-2568]
MAGSGSISATKRSAASTSAPQQAPGAAPTERHPSAEPNITNWSDKVKGLLAIAPPVTLITALLLWYGYVATLQRFRYFGVDLDLTGLSNQSLLLYGAETVYPVAALLLLALLGVTGLHLAVRWLLESPHHLFVRTLAAICATGGVLLIARALIGMLRPVVAETETPGVTPLSLAVGAPLLVYGGWMARRVAVQAAGNREPSWWTGSFAARMEGIAIVIAVGVLATGLFWTANTFAAAYGTGRAEFDAANLHRRPQVALFTRDALPVIPAGVTCNDLGQGVKHRYEYNGLRLLLASDDRLFLVPGAWTADASTLVVPYDDSIRLVLFPNSPRSGVQRTRC